MFVRSGSGAALATVSGVFVTGTLSPVRADSSIWRSCAAASRPSAATICPPDRIRRSPRQTSSARISASSPPRMTRAVGADRERSASRAFSARKSMANPNTTEKTTEATIASASPVWPRRREAMLATSRTRITPPFSWFQRIRQICREAGGGESDGREGTGSSSRPDSGFVRSSRATSSRARACQLGPWRPSPLMSPCIAHKLVEKRVRSRESIRSKTRTSVR